VQLSCATSLIHQLDSVIIEEVKLAAVQMLFPRSISWLQSLLKQSSLLQLSHCNMFSDTSLMGVIETHPSQEGVNSLTAPHSRVEGLQQLAATTPR